MRGHFEMAQRVEALDFGALWMRDILFYDPDYGDVAQMFEPLGHPQPAKRLCQQPADDGPHRHGRVPNNVNISSSHVVVTAIHFKVVVSMLREFDGPFTRWQSNGYF
ncbi:MULTISPECIES: hypothetical protein [Pseudomonas]|jgi:hypothetical protein|nr:MULTISPECIES: hypothetical protein [Pseudomonas]